MSTTPLIVFAGGGTGGHLYPALAVIEWMREHHSNIRFEFLCTNRPVDAQILTHWDLPFEAQSVRPIRMNPRHWPGFIYFWFQSTRLCRQRFAQNRPAVVVGTGGFGSGPAVQIAHKMKIPIVLLNPDAIPGRANKYLGRMADVICAQWKESLPYFLRTDNVKVTGCPVRKTFFTQKNPSDYKTFDLDCDRKTLLITGASLGAGNINRAVVRLIDKIEALGDWQVLHITGGPDEVETRQCYARSHLRSTVVPFTHEMPKGLRCADLAITRAGAVTLAELCATGTPAILMPYPYHRDQHQRANAEVLVRRGAARLVEDVKDAQRNAAALDETLLPLMRNPRQLESMAQCARKLGGSDAAETVSRQILSFIP